MPDTTPFLAASPGAMQHLQINPRFQALVNQGIFKDIWGSEYSNFMGMDPPGGDAGEIPDTPQGRTQSFSADVSVYRCVDIRGAALASVPLKIWDMSDPNKRTEVQHEALEVVQNTNPYAYVAGPQLMRYSLSSRDLHGSFAWHIIYDTGGRTRSPLPRELYWLPPTQYKPVAGADLDPPQPKVPFAGLKVRPGSQKPELFIPASDLVYAPTYSPSNPLIGTSKISALRDDLNLRLYGTRSNLWFFRNNQRPDVVVTGAFSPTIENVGLMRRIWRSAFGGDHSRGPAFLPSDMHVQLLTMAAKDAEWLGQRHAAREDILAAFGVPPPVYGDLARATYENIRSAFEGFWRGMIPEADEIAWYLTQNLLWKWPDAAKNKLVFGFDYAQIEALQEDANAVWERVNAFLGQICLQVERRLLTPNQARPIIGTAIRLMGLPDAAWKGDVPGGDMFYVRLNEIPINESSVQATIDANSARAAVATGQTNKPGNGKWILPDARDVKVPMQSAAGPTAAVPPTPGGALPVGGGGSSKPPVPAQPAAPAPPAKIMIHNHLTRLEFPQLPPFPDELPPPEQQRSRGGLSSGAAGDPPTGHAMLGPRESGQSVSPSPHAQNWLTRRLKRHFQDQQTLALRVLRENDAGTLVDASSLVDIDASRDRLEDLLTTVAAMTNATIDIAQVAAGIEAETMTQIAQALLAAGEDGESPRVLQERVREVFRTAIDERAAQLGQLVAGVQETAA
jgi:phage portal protein BeeE